jgi:predicted NBD/HSP70 family sugar kinase
MFLLFDIGGTKIRLAISRDKESFIAFEVFDTPKKFDEAVDLIKNYLETQNIGIQGAVGGIAGVLDKERARLVFSPNLSDWVGKELKSTLSQITGGGDLVIENDAALSALGEATYGAGKAFDIVAYITIGTGVGGARIVTKKIDRGRYNFEPGHQIIEVNSATSSEVQGSDIEDEIKDLESLISGASIEKSYERELKDINDERVWDKIYRYLAVGLVNTCVFWSPDIVILGGGVVGSEKFEMKKLEEYFKSIMKAYPDPPLLIKGSLGEHAGLYGALQILKQV